MLSKHKFSKAWLFTVVLAFLMFTQTYAQFSAQNYEGTYNLKPGQVELTPNYTFNYFPLSITKDDFANNLGLSVRVGLHKQIDIKASYNWLFSTYIDTTDQTLWQIVDVGPRFSNKNGRIAFRLPMGIVFDQRQKFPSDTDVKYDVNFFISARMLFGAVKKQYFELMISPMGELLFSDKTLFLGGLDLGLGFSSDFSWWSVRPEGTILIDPQNTNDYIWKVGISASIRIGGRPKYDHPDKYDVPMYMK